MNPFLHRCVVRITADKHDHPRRSLSAAMNTEAKENPMKPTFFNLLAGSLLLSAATLAASLGAVEPAKTITYRHDGTGVFPARGLPRSFSERHNILWKTPLPHYGMNAPVVVGDKVFVSCDPGWTSDAPLLIAVDKASGAIAWQAAVDPLDAPEWSEADRTECKRLRAEIYEHQRTFCHLNWRLAQAPDEKTRATVIAEGAKAGLALDDPEKDKRFSVPKDHPRLLNKALLVKKRVFIEGRFIGEGERFFTGLTMSSIVSDGERIYVQNALDAVACFDLSGRRLWIHDLRLNPPAVLTASPCLIDGILVVYSQRGNREAVAFEAFSGKELWRHLPKERGVHYEPGSSPQPLDLGGVKAVYLSSGQVLRLKDGKVLGRLKHPNYEAGHFGNYGESIARGDLLFVNHGQYGCPQPGVFAYRLSLAGETLQNTLLWKFSGFRGDGVTGSYQHLILNGDRLIVADLDAVVAADSGKVLAFLHGISVMDPGPSLADGMLLTVRRYLHARPNPEGYTGPSYTPGADILLHDAATFRQVGQGILEEDPATGDKLRQRTSTQTKASWGWGCGGCGGQQGASAITAEGRCLFLRSNDNLYAIAALVQGGRNDDPAVIAALGNANEAAPLVAHLGDPVPRHRHTAIRRLGTLKVPLAASAAQTLSDLAVNDLYEEIRAAAVETLDACDPAGKAGTKVLLAETEACQVGPKAEGKHFNDMWCKERRERLEHTWAALGDGGKTRLASLWPDLRTSGLRMRSALAILARTGWKCQPALTEALTIVQEPRGPKTDTWHQHGYPHRPAAIAFLPIWLNAIDAAADPAVAAILVKAFPQDLRLYQTLSCHLSAEQLLAWLEPMAAKADPRQQHHLLLAWKALGAQAKPSLERILAQLPAQAATVKGKGKPFAERIREVMTE